MTAAPTSAIDVRRQDLSGWTKAFRNLQREHGFEPLRVEGTLPADLEGTYYRNGAGQFDVHGERYAHWFDADGAVTGVRLEAGRAWGAVKLVRTPNFVREQQEGRRLFGGYDTPMRRPFREIFLQQTKNAANTSVMIWQDRLFAICEPGKPFEIDRADLATLGERDLGVVKRAFSAHPHRVPQRKAIYNLGLSNGPLAKVSVYELPDAGRARTLTEFPVKGPLMVHDFAATERHLVFSIAPLRFSVLPLLLRRGGAMTALRWYAKEGSEIVIVPIDDPSAIVRFRVEAHLAEHVANAFEQDGMIHMDVIRYDDMQGLDRYVRSLIRGAVDAPLQSSVARYVVDPRAKTARFEERLRAPCELPTVSPRVDAQAHRYVYLAGFSSEEASRSRFFDALLKLDVERGAVERFAVGPSECAGEAVFVPRRGGTAEDDGYLLALICDGEKGNSHLAVLDARDLGRGPVARAYFDHAIPPGFHGKWCPRGSSEEVK